MADQSTNRKDRRRRTANADTPANAPQINAFGGKFTPMTTTQCDDIHIAVLRILADIGLTDATDEMIGLVLAAGGELTAAGRLCFPADLVTAALAGVQKQFTLHGQAAIHDLVMGEGRVYCGSGGAAPFVIDLESNVYRPSTLADLSASARLVDALAHIAFFSRSLVARDLEQERDLDINTAMVSLAGTKKHVMTSASSPDHVQDIAAICYDIAGSEAAFRAKPFLSLNINHVVPPLRFHPESCAVMAAAIRAGIPVMANVFGQLGASSPVTMAGSVAQTTAEALAGMVFAWLVDSNARIICGPRPMVTDLRTGAMSGGSGEQAVATAMAVQMMRHYNLVNSTIAGATDSKLPDAQAGYEKALSVSLAVQAGANLVTQACGMQAGLMAVSYPAYIIDNDMIGAILKTAVEIDIRTDTLNIDNIRKVVNSDGHFLGQPDTYARMKTDFLYPDIADRLTPDDWQAQGALTIDERATEKARTILTAHHPSHIDDDTYQRLVTQFGLAPRPDGFTG